MIFLLTCIVVGLGVGLFVLAREIDKTNTQLRALKLDNTGLEDRLLSMERKTGNVASRPAKTGLRVKI